MEPEFSTFMDGNDCPDCDWANRQLEKQHKRIQELESAMQEFVDESKGCTDSIDYAYLCQNFEEKFTQLLTKK